MKKPQLTEQGQEVSDNGEWDVINMTTLGEEFMNDNTRKRGTYDECRMKSFTYWKHKIGETANDKNTG